MKLLTTKSCVQDFSSYFIAKSELLEKVQAGLFTTSDALLVA